MSTRHLSFVESGRATPSRDMLLKLAETLKLPLREQSRLLLAGGYAPLYQERGLDAPDMAQARAAVESILTAHNPFPALAVDRYWNLISANAALQAFLSGVAAHHLEGQVNVLRVSLAPDGLAPLIVNLPEWRQHLLQRLRKDADAACDLTLMALHRELSALSGPTASRHTAPMDSIAVPLRIKSPRTGHILSFLSTTTVFGTATDITLSELTLECFYPADEATRSELLSATSE